MQFNETNAESRNRPHTFKDDWFLTKEQRHQAKDNPFDKWCYKTEYLSTCERIHMNLFLKWDHRSNNVKANTIQSLDENLQ